MKVICIDASPGKKTGELPDFKEGEVLTASQCPVYHDGYDIKEYPCDKNGFERSWSKTRFIPLSSIDETEFERSYNNKELV